MSTTTPRTLLILGSGPGIGTAIPSLFASLHPFTHVVLLARNPSRLATCRSAVLSANPTRKDLEVKTYECDVADQRKLKEVLESVQADVGGVECVFFNAARVAGKGVMEEGWEDVAGDFAITTLALLTTVQTLLPSLQHLSHTSPHSRPSILVTNSMLYRSPLPSLFSLTVTKTAQRSLVQCLQQEYGKDVHIGLVSVEGVVSEEAGREHMSPRRVAERAWELFSQERGEWEGEVEVREQ